MISITRPLFALAYALNVKDKQLKVIIMQYNVHNICTMHRVILVIYSALDIVLQLPVYPEAVPAGVRAWLHPRLHDASAVAGGCGSPVQAEHRSQRPQIR